MLGVWVGQQSQDTALCFALQTKKRAKIRLKEGRAKPIDILAKNLQVRVGPIVRRLLVRRLLLVPPRQRPKPPVCAVWRQHCGLCYAMLCYAMLCLCYAMLCYAMLCYSIDRIAAVWRCR